MTRSISSQMDLRAELNGALAAIFSNTRRSPAAIASARLRSVMSVMLARISRRLELGKRTNRTSQGIDRKSTRLNSSHANISYAVFCLKKKKKYHFGAYYQILLHLQPIAYCLT